MAEINLLFSQGVVATCSGMMAFHLSVCNKLSDPASSP